MARSIPGLGPTTPPAVLRHQKDTCMGAADAEGQRHAPRLAIDQPEPGLRRFRCLDCGASQTVRVVD